jgi:hemerythrin HHE cation binding domain-containing protein
MEHPPSVAQLVLQHHRALLWADRLRRAAGADDEERRQVTADFLAYFYGEVVGNMREQEALLFSAASRDQCAALERTLREHDQKIATARRLVEALAIGAPSGGLLREVATRMHEHVCAEEERLYPTLLRTLDRPERVRQALEGERPEWRLG